MEPNQEQIVTQAVEQFRTVWKEFSGKFADLLEHGHEQKLNPISGAPTFREVNIEFATALEVIQCSDFNSDLLVRIPWFVSIVAQIASHLDSASDKIREAARITSDGNILRVGEDLVGRFKNNEGNEIEHNFSNNIAAARSALGEAVTAFAQVKPFLSIDTRDDFWTRLVTFVDAQERALSIVKSIEERKGEAERITSEVERLRERIESAKTVFDKTASDCKNLLESLRSQSEETLQQLAQKDQDAATKVNEIDAKLKQATAISSEAETLDSQISAQQKALKDFDAQLKNRLDLFENFKQFVDEARTEYGAQSDSIDELTDRADKMIRGATVAGLSHSLDEAATAYGERAFWANVSFYVAIALLALSVLPLAIYVLNVPVSDLLSTEGAVNQIEVTIGGVIGRLALILPAFWLASFTSSQHSKLFNLSNEYRFKATLARSVDGFKREAPDYEQEIAGGVFMDIREKPVSEPTKTQGHQSTPNPLFAYLIKKARVAIDRNSAE